MIKFLVDTTVTGDRFPAGSISNFATVIELQLIAQGVAILCPLAVLIAQSYAGWTRSSVNAAGDATTVTLASVVVPGGTMGPNSVLRITLDWSYTNSASTKALATNWGGINISAPTATTSSGYKGLIEIANKNSLSIQTIQNNTNYGSASRVSPDPTIDTSSDVSLDFRANWGAAASGETITLIGYSVWHYPGS